jgi:transposase
MGKEIADGDVFLFVGRGRRRAKCLWFDGTGLVLLCKVLEQGHFAAVWERAQAGVAQLSTSELMVFLDGCKVVGKAPIVARTYGSDDDKSG